MSQGVFKVMQAMQRKAYFTACGLFPPGADLSWIPTINTISWAPSLETPDGVNMTFTFDVAPKAVLFNGSLLFPNTGYTPSGTAVVFNYAPAADDVIWGVL